MNTIPQDSANSMLQVLQYRPAWHPTTQSVTKVNISKIAKPVSIVNIHMNIRVTVRIQFHTVVSVRTEVIVGIISTRC